MVNVEAYTINEIVMSLFIMYVLIVGVIASAYMRNMVYEKTQWMYFWLNVAFAAWFALVGIVDVRVGHVFAGIGLMGGLTLINTFEAIVVYLREPEEQEEYYPEYQEEAQPWFEG